MRIRKQMNLICPNCQKGFTKYLHHYRADLKINPKKIHFCSLKCLHIFEGNIQQCVCGECEKVFFKTRSDINATKNNFCSSSCAATYNNTHKTKGCRRSKLEVWLEQQLTTLFPDLKILYSDKTAINSELDIYFPSFKLAFELNGIFHYEPIFGKEKLSNIKNNDDRKFQACLEKKIELCIIDVSKQKYFKKNTGVEYLNIITSLINAKVADK